MTLWQAGVCGMVSVRDLVGTRPPESQPFRFTGRCSTAAEGHDAQFAEAVPTCSSPSSVPRRARPPALEQLHSGWLQETSILCSSIDKNSTATVSMLIDDRRL